MKPSSENAVSAFSEIGNAYVEIAFDMPNLFKYLYLNEESRKVKSMQRIYRGLSLKNMKQTSNIVEKIYREKWSYDDKI